MVVENVETLDVGWCVCARARVCVWSIAKLRVRFPVCSGGLVLSVYCTHETEPLGSNRYISLTVRLNMKHENTYGTHHGTQPIRFLDRGTELVRPQQIIAAAGRPEF